jgi:hypothetical protein
MQLHLSALIRLFISISILMITPASNADTLKSLLMPGPVIKAHEKYEQDCNQCHDTSSKDKQGKLCLQCHDHENVLDDINNKEGFHGRLPTSVTSDCKHCHTEHEGRDAKIVLLDPSTFDHSKTDYLLKGAHARTACNACHKEEKKYSEAPHECYTCHKESDVHDGKQKKCEDCHSAQSWKQDAFDHDKKTDFPLKGAHKETICSSCHISQKYKDTPDTCIACHKIQDIHHGGYGTKCELCHSPEKWDKIAFDHGKETDFRLLGQHKKAECNSCHTAEILKKNKQQKKKLPTDCFGCHKHDDSHKGANGEKCKDCHNSESWKKHKFDHDKKTDFPLRGKHKDLSCSFCHKGNLEEEEKLKSDCIGCHKKDDVHRGKQGKQCNNCHNEKGWRDNVFFDHDLSSFPLIGMHAAIQCEECHLTSVYNSTKSECNACHAGDDVHKTRLGTDCETCHNPNSWEIWLFDHDKATRFKIDGAHKDAGCYDCHKTNSKGKLKASRDCISCHRSRDIHNRQFGRQCGNCHSTESFKDVNIKR